MKRDNVTLKTYFETGDYPTETQFADLIDSFLNIEEEDAVTGITNNGDGTYTFQLLSGGTEVIDVGNLSGDIPISSVLGLQAILDGKVSKSGDTMQGDLELPNLAFGDATTSFIAPNTNNNNILFIGGNGAGDKDWKSIHMYSNGVFRVNDYDIWHAGNDQSLFPFSATELPGGQDLNNYQTAGFYYQTTNADASSGSNYPPDLRAGSLIVQKSAGVTQQYYTYNDGSPEIWFRAFYPTSSPQWSSWLKIWHSGNDGGGSGLDADTVDGLQASVFVRNDGTSGTRFGGNYLQFNGDGATNNDFVAYNDATNGFYFNADTTRQNTAANAQVHAGEFFASGAYYYGDGKRIVQFSDSWLRLNPSNNFTNGIYCGSGILRTDGEFQVGPSGTAFKVTNSGAVSQAGDLTIVKNNPWISLDSSSSGSNVNEQAAGISIGESGYKGSAALHLTYTGDGRGHIGMGSVTNSEPANLALEFQYQNKYTIFRGDARMENGHTNYYNGNRIRRYSHVGGYLEGSYNTVGGNGAQSNPIYVIGSSYIPSNTSLGNMYGIGYAHGSQASFLNSTDLGTNPANWGLYIAADGNARIFLNATSGIGYFKNVVYASNFILNSDVRLKEEVEDIPDEKLTVRWRKFKMKGNSEKTQRYGVVAQELEQQYPDFVRTDSEGNKSVAYIDLLVAKNAELEARLEKLEQLNKNLN